MKKGKDTYYQAFIFAGDQCFREGKYELALEYYDESLAIDAISTTYLKKSLANKYLYRWEESIAQWDNYCDSQVVEGAS